MKSSKKFYDELLNIIKADRTYILFICLNNDNNVRLASKILTDDSGRILLSEIEEFPIDTILKLPEKNAVCPQNKNSSFNTNIIKYSHNKFDYEFFIEYFEPRRRVIIFGAGHCGRRLTELLNFFDFDVIVVDDRADLLNGFNGKVKTLNCDFNKLNIKIMNTDYLVIVTRGHTYDKEVLEQVINSDAAYIGMIGSKKRILAVKQLLMTQGISAEKLNRVYSLIGLPISNNDVSEIALAILAEIIAVKNNKLEILKSSSKL